MKNRFAVFADFHSVNDWGGGKPERKREKIKENLINVIIKNMGLKTEISGGSLKLYVKII